MAYNNQSLQGRGIVIETYPVTNQMQTSRGQSRACSAVVGLVVAKLEDQGVMVYAEERKGYWFLGPADRKGKVALRLVDVAAEDGSAWLKHFFVGCTKKAPRSDEC